MSTATPIPPVDRRLTETRHLHLPYTFIPPRTRSAWQNRARTLREHLLVNLGLWPMPDKCPLNPQITGRIDRRDYTVERVYFESMPGFFVTGNLYRTKKKGGPFPGILNPHGHWKNGRLEDGEDGSVPGRCIGFARRGCVAFSWDMIGYNDSTQLTHRFGGRREVLWGLSLMGLQLWNGIRAVDFLQSLPEVDAKRIACTGASGGGTQTFMLTAVDDRIMLSAPVNMVSGHMQGGCLCENGPNVRIDTNNIEIAALTAPRPMMLVSATGDWTVNTPVCEYPALREVYRLFDAEDRLGHVQIDAGHNYNRASREAVYAWFGKWLFGEEDVRRSKERAFRTEPPDDLRVFPAGSRPEHAVDAAGVVDYLVGQSRKQLEKLKPATTKELRKFRHTMGTALRSAVGASIPGRDDLIETPLGRTPGKGYTSQALYIGRKGYGDRVPAVLYTPVRSSQGAALVVHPEGQAGLVDAGDGTIDPVIRGLLAHGRMVLTLDVFMTGAARGARVSPDIHHVNTYNRTDAMNRVQDLITGVAYLRERTGISAVSLVGHGAAGPWGLLACGLDPHIDRAVIDTAAFDADEDEGYLDALFIPCLRRIGGLSTAAALAAPAALLLHNTGTAFRTEWIEDIYRVANARDRLQVLKKPAARQAMVKWAVDGAV